MRDAASPDWDGAAAETGGGLPLRCERGLADRDGETVAPAARLVLHVRGGRHVTVRQRERIWHGVTRAGRFDVLPAGTYWIAEQRDADGAVLVMTLPPAFELAVMEEGGWRRPLAASFGFADRRLEAMVQAFRDAAERGDTQTDAVTFVSVAIVDRLLELAHRPSNSHTFTPTLRRLLDDYLDRHLATLDPAQLATYTGLAKTQFGKVIRETYGASLHHLLIERRIARALPLLRSGVRMTAIAHELGFSSHAHFSTVFRRHTGLTPSECRARETAPGRMEPEAGDALRG